MPTYNCELYVAEAIESILGQTFTDFEFLIIDDCSTDSTINIINSYNDNRIKVITKERNTGYTESLNYGIGIANGKYIARMDGDDISLPTRFEKQLGAFEVDKDLILCGTAIQVIGTNEVKRHPVKHEDIKVKLCFSNAFFHPTVMIRKDIFNIVKYNKDFEPAEDYDLWTKIVFLGKVTNIDDVLLNYRVHNNQVSNYKSNIQIEAMYIAQLRMFQELLSNEIIELEIYKKAFKNKKTESIDEFFNVAKLFKKIKENNNQLKVYKQHKFNRWLQKAKVNFVKNYFEINGFNIKVFLIILSTFSFVDIFLIIKKSFWYKINRLSLRVIIF